MVTTTISCQFTGCDYVAEHSSEAVAIAMLTSHNNVHLGSSLPATRQRAPKVDYPVLKQDITDEEWQTFVAEWERFKRLSGIPAEDITDHLLECCEKSLSRLLLKENPNITMSNEEALLDAMKKMAVLHVATTVRRTKLMALKQDHGQTFREFNANVRAVAATCAYSVKCPHTCCASKAAVDYTSLVVKDILISGIEDGEIRKDVLGMPELDEKSDKDIIKFVEEKEIARNALQMTSTNAGMSSYNKNRKTPANADTTKKLAMRSKCQACQKDFAVYKQFPSGKLNKEPFKSCPSCWKKSKNEKPQPEKNKDETASSDANAIFSFISAIETANDERANANDAETEQSSSDKCMPKLISDNELDVEIRISSDTHVQLGRTTQIPWKSVIVLAQEGYPEECVLGVDFLEKLGCPRSAILHGKKTLNSPSGYPSIGKVVLRIGCNNMYTTKVVYVVESISGLHLNPELLDILWTMSDVEPTGETCATESHVVLDHHIFTPAGWVRASTLSHPKLRLRISTKEEDYIRMGFRYPVIAPKSIDTVTDSGAQSCLWSRSEFLANGFSMKDLIPVRHSMRTANRAPITIDGAILLRLSGKSADGTEFEAAAMVYISPEARSFFLSKHVMIQLGIIAPTFPQIGAAVCSPQVAQVEVQEVDKASNSSDLENSRSALAICGCPRRCLPPGKPNKLPFLPIPENTERMKEWLLNTYSSSVFNQCPHQLLPKMDGPPVSLHVAKDAHPVKFNTPASIPLHWQEKVKEDLERDVKLGVIERVPYGETTDWCHRMVVVRKNDGGPRRCADLSPLNKYCERETHPSRSPFHLARSVPHSSYKTVFDAWNGYHSVPIRKEDRHYTTFVTQWGLFRYVRAPQGYLSSGDGYNRRLDDILAHFERLLRCVDDSMLHDDESKMEDHWWRVIEFLEVTGNSGVVLNPEKFQFSQKTVDFAGFRVAEDTVEPLPKYLDAIREYPTPKNITDIRSWFGLVNQVSFYAKLRELMELSENS